MPARNDILFDAATHQYRLPDGRPLVSVTQLLKAEGFIRDYGYTEDAATRGTYVAEAIVLAEAGTLDPESVDEDIAGYLRAWHDYRRVTRHQVTRMEFIVAHEELGLAGRVDLEARSPDLTIPLLIDIKTGLLEWWHILQLSAYAYCLDPAAYNHQLANLYLHCDGTWRMWIYSTVEHMRARSVVCAALATYQWKLKHGYHQEDRTGVARDSGKHAADARGEGDCPGQGPGDCSVRGRDGDQEPG